jgi:uncharacterized membrane protein
VAAIHSKISIAKHPLHPALVALPIGLLVWAFVADVIYLATDKDPTWYDISFYSGLAGIVTALVAALPGFVDYLTLAKGTNVNDIALLHMATNLLVVGLFAVGAALQWDDGALGGSSLTAVVALHASGVTFLSLAGWLGGEMVFKHHVATIDEESEESSIASQGAGRAQPRGA